MRYLGSGEQLRGSREKTLSKKAGELVGGDAKLLSEISFRVTGSKEGIKA